MCRVFWCSSFTIVFSWAYGETLPPVDLIGVQAAAVIEVAEPLALVDRILAHPARGTIESLPPYQQVVKSPQFGMALAGKLWLENEIGASWREALKVAVGEGLALIGMDDGIVLIGKSPQPERLQRLIPLLAKIASGNAQGKGKNVEPVHQHEGIDVYQIGSVLACRSGDYFFASTKPRLLRDIVLRSRDAKPKDPLSPKVPTPWIEGQGDIRWRGRVEAIRQIAKILQGSREPIKDPGVALLAGGIVQAVATTGMMVGDVQLSEEALTLRTYAKSDAEPGKVAPLVAVCFGTQLTEHAPTFSLTELKPLISLATVRDLGRFWQQRGEFLTNQAAAQLDVADSQLSTVFGGFDFGDEILGACAGPMMGVAVAPTNEAGDPQLGFPMLAGVLQLQPGKEGAAERYRLAFQSAVSLSNVQRAQGGGVQWGLISENYQGFEVVSTRPFFVKASKEKSVASNWTEQQLPTIATNDRYVVVASHRKVARQIVDSLLKESSQPTQGWQTAFRLDGEQAKDWLVFNREMVVAQNMLDKGHSREAAKSEFDAGLALVSLVRQLDANLRFRNGWIEQQTTIELKTVKSR